MPDGYTVKDIERFHDRIHDLEVEVERLREEVERLENVVRLAGRKLSVCSEYAGQDHHLIVNVLLHEAAEAAKESESP